MSSGNERLMEPNKITIEGLKGVEGVLRVEKLRGEERYNAPLFIYLDLFSEKGEGISIGSHVFNYESILSSQPSL